MSAPPETPPTAENPVVAAIDKLGPGFETWVWTDRTIGDRAVLHVESLLGIPFPADYRDFVIDHGCAAITSADGHHGLEIYGLSRSCPTPMDVRERQRQLEACGITDLIPVAGRLRGQPSLAFDATGAFFHLDGDVRTPVDGTFTSLLLLTIDALARPA